VKGVQQKEKWIKKSKVPALWDKAHDRNAKRVLNLIVELEGLWVKLGQYLSTRADVLPQAYISLLTQLQDSLPPRPLQEVCKIYLNVNIRGYTKKEKFFLILCQCGMILKFSDMGLLFIYNMVSLLIY